MPVIEICVDSLESALAAEQGGAQRIELCAALSEGGLTPSLGLLKAVRSRLAIDIHVMIRPRAGDFFYSAGEREIMREDIALARQAGAQGVVFGLLTAEGEVDVEHTRELVAHARPMQVTFHRAFDLARDLARDLGGALEDVIRTGADRLLTSGGEPTATEGQQRLAAMVRASAGRLVIMPGSGVRPENVVELAQATGASEFHASMRRRIASPVRHNASAVHLGDAGSDEYARVVVRAEDVRRLVDSAEAVCDVHSHVSRSKRHSLA